MECLRPELRGPVLESRPGRAGMFGTDGGTGVGQMCALFCGLRSCCCPHRNALMMV